MTFVVRQIDRASIDELETATRMCLATVLETIPEFENELANAARALPNFSFEQMRDMIRADLPKPTHRFLVAISEGGIVGHSMVSRKLTPQSEPYGYFFSRYVMPQFRRRGIADALMREALAWFDESEWSFLLAHTHATNAALRSLFEKHGFRVTEERDGVWPSLVLRKDI
jgi:ribosomal protein S18 acetylase RimI-like enzyme